jgi:exopolysaccharide production protein ExoQ
MAARSISSRATRSVSANGISSSRGGQRPGIKQGRRPGERGGFLLDRNWEGFETAWVAIVVVAVLLNAVLGPLTPLVLIVCVPAFAVLRWESIPRLFLDSWPLLLLPAFVIVSALWSLEPATTVRYGILFLVTVLTGIVMGAAYRGDAVLKGFFLGFCIFSVLSLLSWRFVPWGPGGLAFAGLAGSKNTAGDVAGLAVIVGLATVAWGVQKRRIGYAVAALASIPMALFMLWYSRATGALIAALLASLCLVLWTLSRRLPVQVRVSIGAMAVLTVIVAILLQHLWLPPVFEWVLEETGKDADLTGRVDLWRKADELIAARPWLGLGYNAFWLHNNLDAEYLWRLMGIRSRSGFNFHSTYREIVVHVGYVGFALFVVVAAVGSLKLLTKTMLEPRMPAIMMCGVLVFFIPKLPFEVIGFGTMHFATIMGFAILAMGYRSSQHRDSAGNASGHLHAIRS